MKTLKTYGVYGMVEKSIILHHRGVDLHVTFTGGSANTSGIIPAKYTTDNPVFQSIIESSRLFEQKNIRLVRSINVKEEGDDKPKLVKASAKALAELMGKFEAKEEDAPETVAAVEEAGDGMTEVVVTDIQSDGRQYLIKECGLKANELRSKSQIEKAAADLGVRFVVK